MSCVPSPTNVFFLSLFPSGVCFLIAFPGCGSWPGQTCPFWLNIKEQQDWKELSSEPNICKRLWSPGIDSASLWYTATKSHLRVPFLGIAGPQSQFPHSCVWELFIYSKDRSTYFLHQNGGLGPHGSMEKRGYNDVGRAAFRPLAPSTQ